MFCCRVFRVLVRLFVVWGVLYFILKYKGRYVYEMLFLLYRVFSGFFEDGAGGRGAGFVFGVDLGRVWARVV